MRGLDYLSLHLIFQKKGANAAIKPNEKL